MKAEHTNQNRNKSGGFLHWFINQAEREKRTNKTGIVPGIGIRLSK